jgi:2-hydroxychromene-2-carboxylate isomerase
LRTDPAALALACLAAEAQGALVPCCRLLQQLIFVDSAVIDDTAIAALPSSLGLNPGEFRRHFEAPETRARHEVLLDEARTRGAFGVPTFFLGDRMFWGNDRLVLLEAALRGVLLPSFNGPETSQG